MRVALDTNIVAYAEGVGDARRQNLALEVLAGLGKCDVMLPAQVLGELFVVLLRKAGRARSDVRRAVLEWHDGFAVEDTTAPAMLAALDLVVDHELGLWDATILAVAAGSGCRLLLSEDLQHGFTWRGLTVVNPFAAERHPLLEAVLED